jgi:hypothetical protein
MDGALRFQAESCTVSLFSSFVALQAAPSRAIARTFSVYRIFLEQNRYTLLPKMH